MGQDIRGSLLWDDEPALEDEDKSWDDDEGFGVTDEDCEVIEYMGCEPDDCFPIKTRIATAGMNKKR